MSLNTIHNKKLLICFTLLASFFWACGSDSLFLTAEEEFRLIAWESLSSQEKETVIIDLDEAKVDMDDTYSIVNSENESEEVPAVSVRFNTEDDPILGPIIVYIEPESKEVLGQAPRF